MAILCITYNCRSTSKLKMRVLLTAMPQGGPYYGCALCLSITHVERMPVRHYSDDVSAIVTPTER